MRKNALLVILALVSCMSIHAAKVRVVVMDTCQSLLNEAVVKNVCAGKTYKTSVDGCAVIEAEPKQLLKISANGYLPQSMRWNGKDSTVVVKLTPIKERKSKDLRVGGGRRRDMSDVEDGAIYMCTTSAVERRYSATGKASSNSVSAGKLTAGEVNDFAKWNLWSGVLNGDLSTYIKDWKFDLGERFMVQVQNKNGFPVANQFVTLTDANGKTLYQARTDNTGKAELWGRMAKGEWLIVNGEKQMANAYGQGLNLFVLDEPCEASDVTDVMFVVDATGSMGDEIRYLQAEMKDVIRRSQGAVDGLTIRTGALVYRDYSDNYLTRISRLGNDIDLTQRFIDKQEASGGGDYEEAVPEALKAALSVAGWDDNARARILFLVLDAPCHKDSATLAMLHEQILDAAAMGVRIVPVVCSGLGKSGELLMREMALATNGTSFFLTDDSGIGNPHLKPTIDSLKVEHLNDMLVRTIIEYSTMPECSGEPEETEMQIEPYIPNPFNAQDIANDPTIPHGETMLYVIDVTGKVIGRMEGEMDAVTPEQLISRYSVSTGVYFIKAFYDGEWHTRKILVYRF